MAHAKTRGNAGTVARRACAALLGVACLPVACTAPAPQQPAPTHAEAGPLRGIALPTRTALELERASALPPTGSPLAPEFARSDGRLGSQPPTLASDGIAWRVTYDREFIQSGRPMPTYRQTLRSVERAQR